MLRPLTSKGGTSGSHSPHPQVKFLVPYFIQESVRSPLYKEQCTGGKPRHKLRVQMPTCSVVLCISSEGSHECPPHHLHSSQAKEAPGGWEEWL